MIAMSLSIGRVMRPSPGFPSPPRKRGSRGERPSGWPCWSGRPPTASNVPGCGVSTTQPREPPNDDYQDWPGYLQACLSAAWRRRERAAGVAPAGAAQRDGEVLRQAASDADRAGSVRGLALLGPGVGWLGA